ncbi:MAG: SDR family NAD(P)-dependent oxidoreductase [Alphaproteobacteria bacterium]|nr:SDR family NAD(P)-dependent oxidoreductase [Alphaproteobacteria bacterium]
MPTVLITGANRGLGRGFAERFGEAGWRVIATCRDPESAGLGGEVHALDVTSDSSVQSLASALQGEPIDLLLNNAGIYGPRDYGFGSIDYDAWAEVVAVDALAPVRVAEALSENVAASDRKLMVFISSMMGSIAQTGSGDSIIYRSAKACLNASVNVLANGLKSRGIACVLFHPGWVRTDMGGPSAAIDITTSVRGMVNVIDRLTLEDSGRFINYDGFDIPW